MRYGLFVLGLMLLLIVGAVVDARLVLFFGLNALDHVVVGGGGAGAVDADAVNNFMGEAVGVAAVSASLSERLSNCKKTG
jgi:siroheme synthase (precorrin-2 oxidase/ferrochelatase)